jgi:hypothetical protein
MTYYQICAELMLAAATAAALFYCGLCLEAMLVYSLAVTPGFL